MQSNSSMCLGHLCECGMMTLKIEIYSRVFVVARWICASIEYFGNNVMFDSRLESTKQRKIWIMCMSDSRYFVTFTNDFYHKIWVHFLKQNFEVFTKFKLWKTEVENQTNIKISFCRQITEYTNSNFKRFYEKHVFVRHHSKMVCQREWIGL